MTSHSIPIPNLLCQETSCFAAAADLPDPSPIALITPDSFPDSEEYVHLLLHREKAASPLSTSSKSAPLPDSNSRLHAVDYILHTKELLGFELPTAYLSVSYLDRFLSLRALEADKPWAMQLLSVGCLSLAAKMQESNAWGLSSFQSGEFKFDAKAIQRMEILVMFTLKWSLGSTTPFAFLPYFVHLLFAAPPPRAALSGIVEHVIAFIRDANLVDHYQSAIALAAVLIQLDRRLTRKTIELKMSVISCSRFLDLDDVLSCYNKMQQPLRDRSEVPKPFGTSDFSPLSILSFGDSSSTSRSGIKRKRLEFDDADEQSEGLPDNRQPPGN